MKVLPLPGCQHVVTCEQCGPGAVRIVPRLCDALAVAVLRSDDGQERFVCVDHVPPAELADLGEPWRLHRRIVAAPISRSASVGRVHQHRGAP